MNRRVIGLMLIVLTALIIVAGVSAYIALKYFGSNSNAGTPTPGAVTGSTGTASSLTVVVGKRCGVTRTSTGYTFSWLHVANGYIVDDENCIVDLKGFNWSRLEFYNGVGGDGKLKISEQGIAWFNQAFRMNLWRIPLNTTWWNENVYVPLAGMNYRDWIQRVVKWAEQNGDYVILTKGPQFHNPPCGGTVTFCPSQNQGEKNILADPNNPTLQDEETSGRNIGPAVTMWTSVAKIFANDPAILYNSWNEMHDIDPQTWQNNQNTLIATIRAQNPRALILFSGTNFGGNINPLVHGKVPNFTQPNIVYDFHVYNGFNGIYQGKPCVEPPSYLWQDWPQHAEEQVGFSQQHGNAVAISEWGGCNDLADYNDALTSYARSHHIAMAYYNESNVINVVDGSYQLNENGFKVQQAYASS